MTGKEDPLSRLYTEYIQAFQTLDPLAILPYYHVPSVMISSQEVIVMTTTAEVEACFAKMMKGLKKRSYARTEIEEIHVTQMSDGIALLSVEFMRYKTDGEKLHRLKATYTFRRTDGGWMIVTVVSGDPEKIYG